MVRGRKSVEEAFAHLFSRGQGVTLAISHIDAAFDAGGVIEGRLDALLDGPWKNHRPPEIRDLYFLRRRLGGGCE